MQRIRRFFSKRKSSTVKKPVVDEASRDNESSSKTTSKGPLPPLPSSGSSAKSGQVTTLPEPLYPATLQALEANGSPEFCLQPRMLPDAIEAPAVPTDQVISSIDAQDKGTPDEWIPRDPRMIRLTGKHPFNAEAKLTDLYGQGFLTSTNLFFVRSHGAVPRVDAQMAIDWKVEIKGLCDNPVIFAIDDFRKMFEVVTVPITLVCAGNRRKEQNVVQKSLGFNWGAAGTSTALFTGVRLADVLDFIQPQRGAKHVVFEGGDSLPNGPYGTSQLTSWAKDPRRGMMLAWAMNGLPLEPDHGFPIRLVVPGQVAGRSVKWLRKIELSAIESQHYLHFHDNKVLPMPVGPDQARADKSWWYDSRYMIRELNVNSAIACPDHDEVLKGDIQDTYTLRGYAYAGGGRRITRVEISLDEGTTWELAEIQYPEDQFRNFAFDDAIYGKVDLTQSDQCFCWSFWSFQVTVGRLSEAPAITARAMDESLALQPRDMYWNAGGMMNNWWFRVCIHHLDDGSMRFEHPTVAGTQPGGWMQRLKDQGRDPAKPIFGVSGSNETVRDDDLVVQEVVSMTKPGVTRRITKEELAEHTNADNPWFVVKGEVYDATEYLAEHPGGPQSITLVAGEDATDDFMAIHSADARRKLAEFHIGTLVGSLVGGDQPTDDSDKPGVFLHPKKWKPSRLVSVKDVSKDSKVFRFALEGDDQALGLPVGQHVYVRLKRKVERSGQKVSEGELVQRAYTPLSRQNDKGFIDMLVKIYYPTPTFPTGGKMTLGFAELEAGDAVELKGPIGHFIWQGDGKALIHGTTTVVREVGMVCAGSGITPILQVLRGIFEDPSDTTTKAWVLDINREFDDILCREELDSLASQFPSRFSLRYSLTAKNIPVDWNHSVGRVNLEMLEAHLPSPSKEGVVCLCGPPPMEQSVKDSLTAMGWRPTSQIIIF